MSRKLVCVSPVGPLMLGPLQADALERLAYWPEPLNLVCGATDLPATWSLEQKGSCVALTKLIEAYLTSPQMLDGLLSGFQLIVAFSKSNAANADARNIASHLGTPIVDIEKKPAYLVRIDLALVELIDQMASQALARFNDDEISGLLAVKTIVDRKPLRWHIAWMTLLLVFLHEVGHVLRGHMSPALTAFAFSIPNGANLTLIHELDADLFSNSALATILINMDSMVPSGSPPNTYKFVVGALAGRLLFESLAHLYGTTPSTTHPTKPVRALWSVHDIGKRLGVDESALKKFFVLVDCRFGANDTEISAEQVRQGIAWGHWQTLHDIGYFKTYFP
jgi:hypothetical protein